MKLTLALTLLLFQNLVAHTQNALSSKMSPDSVLVRVYQKLNSLKKLKYDNIRELNYSSEHYLNISKWAVYYDFKSIDTIAGFKYQITDSTATQIFNGTEKFELDKKNMTMQVNDHPNKSSISSLSSLYNSLITLRNVLPLIINDKTATRSVIDTTINNRVYSLVTVDIGKRRIQNIGTGFDAMTTKSDFIYKIIIEKDSYLPVEVLQKNNVNEDFIRTNFKNIRTDIDAPTEISWYYSTYSNEFKPATGMAIPKLLSSGALSPEWKLKVYNEDRMISLNDQKDTVILLDFWIKNCGPCIQSVPHLNELQKRFKNKNFKIISINSYDANEDVSWFCDKHKTDYTVLLNGKAVAERYGVSAFPTFFILDKSGKIIYSNVGYDASIQTQVEQIIKSAL